MPPDLPGLYFDEEKKRYFPLSKKPAGASKSPTPGALTLKTRSEHTKNAASRASQRADTQVKPQKIWSVYHAARNMHTSIVDSSRRHDLQ
jgi:WD repeat-containing protein 21A